jgi:hypothetical protein
MNLVIWSSGYLVIDLIIDSRDLVIGRTIGRSGDRAIGQ